MPIRDPSEDPSWPGNVRKLENTIEYAATMTTRDVIVEDLILQSRTIQESKAKLAGKYRSDFYDLLKKHDLNPSDFKRTKYGV
jgi:two-component system response regulator GlrR